MSEKVGANTVTRQNKTGRAEADVSPPYRLFDMHCHLDLMSNAEEVARDAATRGIAIFNTTVAPGDSQDAQQRFAETPNVRVGAGLHPWWLANGRCDGTDAAKAALAAARSTFVGEVGLDFSPRYQENRALQIEALDLILRSCAERPRAGRVISLHAVRSAGTVLDILERYDLTRSATCIFHWFSGTSDELAHARKIGCYFSINERMLASKKGREYAHQIPVERLVLETDAPPEFNVPYAAEALETSLAATLGRLADLRKMSRDELASRVAGTSARLLGFSN